MGNVGVDVKGRNFNPRSPWGERRQHQREHNPRPVFQSTLPVGGATEFYADQMALVTISIHAPRGGSDCAIVRPFAGIVKFQSTLPVGGATFFAGIPIPAPAISIHAPRGGSD